MLVLAHLLTCAVLASALVLVILTQGTVSALRSAAARSRGTSGSCADRPAAEPEPEQLMRIAA